MRSGSGPKFVRSIPSRMSRRGCAVRLQGEVPRNGLTICKNASLQKVTCPDTTDFTAQPFDINEPLTAITRGPLPSA
jgi:hypothetical protein